MGHPVLLDTWISSHQGFQSTEPAKNLPVFAGRLEPEAGVAPSLHAQLAVVLALLPVDERVAVRGHFMVCIGQEKGGGNIQIVGQCTLSKYPS